jgi:murein DD-endopeptidase MepM/ murein hydrolase activator NlpD
VSVTLLAVLGLAVPAPVTLALPVEPACISSPFGLRKPPGPHALGPHYGIDLPAVAGAPVRAAADGQVISIHRRGPGGLEMAIASRGPAGPFVTIYAHLGLIAPAFASGRTMVHAGDRIAVVGRSGVIYGTHLYFEVMVNGQPVDPAPWLPVRPCG